MSNPNELYGYEERLQALTDTQQRLAEADAALAIDPSNTNARSLRAVTLNTLPYLQRSVQNHPDHAKVEQQKALVAAAVEANIRITSQTANFDTGLADLADLATKAGRHDLARDLKKLQGGK